MESVKALLWTFFAGFLGQCGKNCAEKNGVSLSENYISPHGCTDFIAFIGESFLDQIKREIKIANIICSLNNGSTNCAIEVTRKHSFPANVKEWFKQIYDLLQKYCKCFCICTTIWIVLISVPFILKHCCIGWFWDQAPDAVRLFLQQIDDWLTEYYKYFWICTAIWIGLIFVLLLLIYCCKAKLASQNETLISEDRIANQGENTGPNTSQTSATEAGNEAKLAYQNEALISEDRSANQGENARLCPGQTSTKVAGNESMRDALILHAEDARESVEVYQNHLKNDLQREIQMKLHVDVRDEVGFGRGELNVLNQVFKKYRYIFVFLTEHFIDDPLCQRLTEMAILETLSSPDYSHRVIPIWSTQINKDEKNKYPLEIRSLTKIKYFDFLNPNLKAAYIRKMKQIFVKGRQSYP